MKPGLATIVAFCLLAILPAANATDRAVVLVTDKTCGMKTISGLDIRKAYLGIGLSYEGRNIRAFRPSSDEQLNQVFYQSVVVMSKKSYERRLLRMLLKYGRPRPREFDTVDGIAAAVIENECSIAYMWLNDAEARSELKIIKTLWQEN